MAKHVVNGDQANGWYCYECNFFTRDVDEACAHDGLPEDSWDDKAKALYRRLTEQQKLGGSALVDDVLDLMDLLLAHVARKET